MFKYNIPVKAVIVIFLMFLNLQFLKGHIITNNSQNRYTILGVVTDINDKPLEFANVILLKLPDSLIITGINTNQNGKYEIDNILYGKYIVKVQLIGYITAYSGEIDPDKNIQNITIDTLRLSQSSKHIKEVEITGNRLTVTQQADKKVIDVQKDLDAATGSAVDILQKSPAVTVASDNTVSINGRSDITVLIDGKQSALKGSDALNSISASQIDKIEIITNPSSKYDSQGIGGIINIITKKGRIEGLDGLANISTGLNDKFKAETNLNYHHGLFNYSAQLKLDNFTYLVRSSRYRIIYNPIIDSFYQDAFNRKLILNDDLAKAAIGIKLPKFSTEIEAETGYWFFGKRKNGYQNTWTVPENINNYSNTYFASDVIWHYSDINYTLNFIFDKPNHKLENLIFYSYGYDQTSYETDSWLANNEQISTGSPDKVISGQHGYDKVLRIQSDYTNPIYENIALEAGLLANMSYEKEKYYNQYFDTITNIWLNYNPFQDIMTDRNYIFSAYVNLKGKSDKLDYQAGLRAEDNNRDITLNSDNPDILVKSLQLFPSLSVSYKLSSNSRLFIAYSRRINRPDPWLLVPFVQLNDEYTKTIGNPGLNPELNNYYEAGMEKKFNNWQISINAFGRVISNKIWMLNIQENGYNFLYAFINVHQQTMNGLELHISKILWNVLDININSSIFYNSYYGIYNLKYLTTYGINLNSANDTLSSSNLSWNANATIGLKITSSTSVQIFGMYNGLMKVPQGEDLPDYFANVSVQQEIFNRKLKINLTVNDVFNTNRLFGDIIDYSNYYAKYSNWRIPYAVLGITYNFNNYKSENRKKSDLEKGGF